MPTAPLPKSAVANIWPTKGRYYAIKKSTKCTVQIDKKTYDRLREVGGIPGRPAKSSKSKSPKSPKPSKPRSKSPKPSKPRSKSPKPSKPRSKSPKPRSKSPKPSKPKPKPSKPSKPKPKPSKPKPKPKRSKSPKPKSKSRSPTKPTKASNEMAAKVKNLLHQLNNDDGYDAVHHAVHEMKSLTFAEAKAIADGKKQMWVLEPQSGWYKVTLLTAGDEMFYDRDGDDDDYVGFFYKDRGDPATAEVTSGSGGTSGEWPKVTPQLVKTLEKLAKP